MDTRVYKSQGEMDALRMMGMKKVHQITLGSLQDADWAEVAQFIVPTSMSQALTSRYPHNFQVVHVLVLDINTTFRISSLAEYISRRKEFTINLYVHDEDATWERSLSNRAFFFNESPDEVYHEAMDDAEEWLEDIFSKWGG